MKRRGNLWPEVIAFANLHRAAKKAQRGKRARPDVLRFHFNLEEELWRLHDELLGRTYQPGRFRTFMIQEPKARQISAAPYRDRVVHHALCNVLEPVFERGFVFDSYACRAGKGTHAAVHRGQEFARRYRYVLKADVRKFFPSIDHKILKAALARKVKDPDVLGLAGLIIDHANPQEPCIRWFPGDDLFTPLERRRGLPIGNQTSQFFANVYLDALDHFVKERLRMPGYVRYCDDFLVFSDDQRELKSALARIATFLEGFRLVLHPDKSVIFPTVQGIRFLGYRIFPTHRLLARENVHRFRRRLRSMQRDFALGRITLEQVRPRIQSWIAHARHADTYRLRARLFGDHPFDRSTTERPRPSGRLVEQQREEPPLGEPQQERAGEPQQQRGLPSRQHFAADRT
jgi:retron-type reverse transcriptase